MLHPHKREIQVQIQNRFAALALIPPDNVGSRGDTPAKKIYEAAISIAADTKVRNPTSCPQVPNNSERGICKGKGMAH